MTLYKVAKMFGTCAAETILAALIGGRTRRGRTYDRKRSDQITAKFFARRGPSTYAQKPPLMVAEQLGVFLKTKACGDKSLV